MAEGGKVLGKGLSGVEVGKIYGNVKVQKVAWGLVVWAVVGVGGIC